MSHERWIEAACSLVLVCMAYAFGRYSAPDRVVTVDRVVTREDTAAHQQVAELTKQLATLKSHTTRKTVIATLPSGAKTTTIDEDTQVDTITGTTTQTDATADVHEVKSVEVLKTVTVERARPDWRITPMAGFDIPSHAFVYGVAVDRRILGPILFGVWGLSSGVAGAALSVEF